VLLTLVGGALTMAARAATRVHRLQSGDAIPVLSLRTASGDESLVAGNAGVQVVMLFDTRCTHCHAQLDSVAAHSGDLGATPITFVTAERALDPQFAARWPALSARARWGMANPAELKKVFGPLVTPQTLIIDRQGRIHARYTGVVSPATLQRVLSSM
jgi:hypothetical protein